MMLRKQASPASFYAGSRRLPSVLATISIPDFTPEQCAFLRSEFDRHDCLSNDGGASLPDLPGAQFIGIVIEAHAALLRAAQFYFPEGGELVERDASGALRVALPKVPCATEVSAELFRRLIPLCARSATGQQPIGGWLGPLRAELGKVQQPFLAATQMPRAAHDLDIPALEWHSVFIQAGHGAKSVVLTGTITEQTPSIGVHFAREKDKANTVLARAGFPIARGGSVGTLEQGRVQAKALGFPVVVKPADRDGGVAVSSDVRDFAEFDQAFKRARDVSARVMVEKHIEGTDYRLLFHRDNLLVTLERTPGGVVGNGKDTVARLLELVNQEPGRGTSDQALLYVIEFDDEAKLMLRRHGLTAQSVPEKGRFIPLRRAANHALGGRVRRVDDLHPDNIDLARRAMRLLRLDLAGMDLLLPDATKSWRETGGAICEVNAQPFVGEVISRDFYKQIIEALVPDGGRIPLVLVIGAVPKAEIRKLEKRIAGLTVVDANGAWRGGFPLSVDGLPWPEACQAALLDDQTHAALFILDPAQNMPAVSPADRYTAAFVLEAPHDGISPSFAATLQRAGKAIYALPEAAPALKKAGLKSSPIQKADFAVALGAALAGETRPAAARKAPARREKAPPASRKRR